MAGTRLRLASTAGISFLALLFYAIYSAVIHQWLNVDSPGEGIYRLFRRPYVMDPFIVNRSGIRLLKNNKIWSGAKMENIKELFDSVIFQVDLQLHIITTNVSSNIPDNNNHEKLIIESQKLLVDALQNGTRTLSRVHEDVQSPSHPSISIRVSSSKNSGNMIISCDNLNLNDLVQITMQKDIQKTPRTVTKGNTHKLFLAIGCTEEKTPNNLDIDDDGNILLRIHEEMSIQQLQDLLSNDIAVFAHNYLLTKPKMASSPELRWLHTHSSLNLMISIIDQDPTSYASYHNYIDDQNIQHNHLLHSKLHHELLTDTLSNISQQTLVPMISHRLNQLVNVQINSQALSSSIIQKDEHDNYLNRIHQINGFNYINSADVDELFIHPFFSSSHSAGIYNGRKGGDNWNLVVLIPPRDVIPLTIMKDSSDSRMDTKSMSNTFTIHENKTIVCILNLTDEEHEFVNNSTHDDKLFVSQLYKDSTLDCISSFGEFIRGKVGLDDSNQKLFTFSSETSGATTSTNTGISLNLNHLPRIYGIAQWEINKLMRHSWKQKSYFVLDRLQDIVDYVRKWKNIALTKESATLIIEITTLLEESFFLRYSNVKMSVEKMNDALNLANRLIEDRTIMDAMYFSLEQIMAVLGALLMPLFIVFVVGWLKEVKRFRSRKVTKNKLKSE